MSTTKTTASLHSSQTQPINQDDTSDDSDDNDAVPPTITNRNKSFQTAASWAGHLMSCICNSILLVTATCLTIGWAFCYPLTLYWVFWKQTETQRIESKYTESLDGTIVQRKTLGWLNDGDDEIVGITFEYDYNFHHHHSDDHDTAATTGSSSQTFRRGPTRMPQTINPPPYAVGNTIQLKCMPQKPRSAIPRCLLLDSLDVCDPFISKQFRYEKKKESSFHCKRFCIHWIIKNPLIWILYHSSFVYVACTIYISPLTWISACMIIIATPLTSILFSYPFYQLVKGDFNMLLENGGYLVIIGK